MSAYGVYPQPFPGLTIVPPKVNPLPGQVVVGYEVIDPQPGCCKCNTLNKRGMVGLIVTAIIFWPVSFLVCMMRSCHESQQRPWYGYPTAGVPVAMAPAPGGGYTVVAPQHQQYYSAPGKGTV